MDDTSNKWLAELRRLNGFDRKPPARDVIPSSCHVLSNATAQTTRRKGPHRLDNIIRGDSLAIRVTNHRARAGMKPKGFSR